MRTQSWLVTMVAVLAIFGVVCAEELPADLAGKVKELAPEATVRRTQVRERRGENYYRVDLTLPGDKNGRIELKPDGTVLDLKLELSADQLPDPVKKALAELYPKAVFDNADRNLNDGKPVIDVEYKLDGRLLTVTVDDAGNVLDREDEVTTADLPAAAQAVLARDYAGATIDRVRRLFRDGQDLFEVRVERRMTVLLPDPAGSVTTEREVPAVDLPAATRAAAAAATGRDPADLTIVQRTTSPVTVYEIQVNDRRDLEFNLAGVLLNPPDPVQAQPGAAGAAGAVGAAGGAPAAVAPGGNRANGRGVPGGPGGPGGPDGQRGPRGQGRPARAGEPAQADGKQPAPANGNPIAPPPEEEF